MARDYTTVSPVQQFDDMACWAASMEWWLNYMGGSRPQMTQYDIIQIKKVKDNSYYPEDTDEGNADQNFGGLTKAGMKALFNYSPFKMQYKKYGAGALKLASLTKRLKKSPIVIMYYDATVQGYHANVVVKAEEVLWGLANGVTSMEPPNPSFESRFLSWFTSGEVYIGWAD
jgi:hypothetical protein